MLPRLTVGVDEFVVVAAAGPWCRCAACRPPEAVFLKIHCRSAGQPAPNWRVLVLTMRLAVWWPIFWRRHLCAAGRRRTSPDQGPCPRHNLGVWRRCGSSIACHKERAASRPPTASPWPVAVVAAIPNWRLSEVPGRTCVGGWMKKGWHSSY